VPNGPSRPAWKACPLRAERDISGKIPSQVLLHLIPTVARSNTL